MEPHHEFKKHVGTIWNQLQRDWFYHGLASLDLTPRQGVDAQKALRHLSAIQKSFESKHEHKEAAVAYLLSQWFEDEPKWEVQAPSGGEK